MIEINNLTDASIDEKFLKKIADVTLSGEGRKKERLSVAFVGKEIIKNLNRDYRKKNRPTDILSFYYDFSFQNFSEQRGELGEIIICPSEVQKNAEMFNSNFKKELKKVLIHGILHLLGYDHEAGGAAAKKMKEKENYYLKY